MHLELMETNLFFFLPKLDYATLFKQKVIKFVVTL